MAQHFYYIDEYQQRRGPIDIRELMSFDCSSQQISITPTTYVWTYGMRKWVLARDVQELNLLFENTPLHQITASDRGNHTEKSTPTQTNNRLLLPSPASIILAVVVSIWIPIFTQWYLNVWFRNNFNPSGWIVLQPHLRVQSTLICFFITYFISLNFLLLSKKKWKWYLYPIHLICTFLWTGMWAFMCYVIATD